MPPSKQPCGHEWKYNHKCGMGPEGEPIEFCCGCDAEERLREIERLKKQIEELEEVIEAREMDGWDRSR